MLGLGNLNIFLNYLFFFFFFFFFKALFGLAIIW